MNRIKNGDCIYPGYHYILITYDKTFFPNLKKEQHNIPRCTMFISSICLINSNRLQIETG